MRLERITLIMVDEANQLLRTSCGFFYMFFGGGSGHGSEKGVMVGATNFMDNLDQAIMRRFMFKLQFDYLNEAGKRLFFERMFKTKLTEEEASELKDVRNLALGDFRTVRQSMYYLGGAITNSQRIATLAKESEVKKDTKKVGRIGFGG